MTPPEQGGARRTTPLPLSSGAEGEAVRDIQDRLVRSGFGPITDPAGEFGPATEAAVRRFQAERQMRVDGICGSQTWDALTEATWQLGDRLLYLCRPMLRGDDVTHLQVRLSALGFDAGRVDGIFGPDTERALLDFQRNAGLTSDRICGPEVVATLDRMASRGGSTTKAGVREREALLSAPRELAGRRILIAEEGGLGALADSLGRTLRDLGAEILVSHQPDGSAQAREANGFDAQVCLALHLRDTPGVHASYWSTTGYESVGGRRLAQLLVERCQADLDLHPAEAAGMRLTLLRETRMPAVVCEIGPPDLAVVGAARLAEALSDALSRWVADPVEH
ncbi:MAG TPA: peptidoglycan-binding protein [Acidimicrobiales bacterium]|nr:peptidoglycan-binding protein [Acidimicrobiales bacterium]